MPTMTQAGYTPPKAEPPRAKPSKAPQQPKKKKKGKKKRGMSGAALASLIIFAVAMVIGAGTIYIYTQTQQYLQTFLPGTMLMGYPLDGASRADALALMDRIEEEHISPWQMEISCMGQSYVLTARDVGLAIDREATLEPLWALGREGGMVARYLQMLRLYQSPVNGQPVLKYDLSAVDEMLALIRADVECDAVDATVSYTPGSAQPFAFTDEEMGYALDVTGIREGIGQDIARLSSGSLTLEPEVIEPKVYRAVLENAIVLRSFVKAQVKGDAATAGNVMLAVRALNGLRVEPGETLSFNEAVGARTQEAGYQIAPEPAYGEHVSGVGGGVCQAATALYRAALLGGMEIVQRSAAARPVDYCEMGQEAAVSDQGLDLVIRNQTESPLFITTRMYTDGDNGTFMELMLIGEALGVRYALESLAQETGMIEEPVYVRDSEGQYATYTDERVPVSEALMGYAAGVERVTLGTDGAEIAREIISENEYAAAAPMIYVGVQKREE